MCGVPYHAATGYVARLVAQGFRVALCEQMEDPRTAKGVVKREVVRVITPGTQLEAAALEAAETSFVLALEPGPVEPGRRLAGAHHRRVLRRRVGRPGPLRPPARRDRRHPAARDPASAADAELPAWLDDPAQPEGADPPRPGRGPQLRARAGAPRAPRPLRCRDPRGLRLRGACRARPPPPARRCATCARRRSATSPTSPTPRHPRRRRTCSSIDSLTRRNLELVESLADGGRRGTLLDVLDHTRTAMGGRLLREWILRPLVELERDPGPARRRRGAGLPRPRARAAARGAGAGPGPRPHPRPRHARHRRARATWWPSARRSAPCPAAAEALGRVPGPPRPAAGSRTSTRRSTSPTTSSATLVDEPPGARPRGRLRPRRRRPRARRAALARAAAGGRRSPRSRSASASAPGSPRSRSASTASSATTSRSARSNLGAGARRLRAQADDRRAASASSPPSSRSTRTGCCAPTS